MKRYVDCEIKILIGGPGAIQIFCRPFEILTVHGEKENTSRRDHYFSIFGDFSGTYCASPSTRGFMIPSLKDTHRSTVVEKIKYPDRQDHLSIFGNFS